jgi:hypothetical protein
VKNINIFNRFTGGQAHRRIATAAHGSNLLLPEATKPMGGS